MGEAEHRLSRRYPELRHFASRDDANRAVYAWNKQLMKMPRFWLGLVGYTCGVGVTVAAILIAVRPWLHIPSHMYGGIVGGVTGGSGLVMVTWFWRHRCRRFLRQQLAAHGIPVCLKCGYDLRGQTEPRCSECGTSFDTGLIDQSRDHDVSDTC